MCFFFWHVSKVFLCNTQTNLMLLSHLGEYLASMNVWNSRWIRPQVAIWSWICYRSSLNLSLPISYAWNARFTNSTNGLPNAYANQWRITLFTTFAECTEALRFAPLTEWRMFLYANMYIWISRWIRPKWWLDSEYLHLGLTPRSSSVGPLLTNILRIYY